MDKDKLLSIIAYIIGIGAIIFTIIMIILMVTK